MYITTIKFSQLFILQTLAYNVSRGSQTAVPTYYTLIQLVLSCVQYSRYTSLLIFDQVMEMINHKSYSRWKLYNTVVTLWLSVVHLIFLVRINPFQNNPHHLYTQLAYPVGAE